MEIHIYSNSEWYKYKFNLQPIIRAFSQAESAFLQVEIFWFGLHTFLQFLNKLLKTGNNIQQS